MLKHYLTEFEAMVNQISIELFKCDEVIDVAKKANLNKPGKGAKPSKKNHHKKVYLSP